MLDVKAIKERLAGISPGKWNVRKTYRKNAPYDVMDGNYDRDDYQGWIAYKMGKADADFIAHAPDDIRALLEALEVAEARAEEYAKDLAKCWDTDGKFSPYRAKKHLTERNRWKTRAQALERAVKTITDNPCESCQHDGSVSAWYTTGKCFDCVHYSFDNHCRNDNWQFNFDGFEGREGAE